MKMAIGTLLLEKCFRIKSSRQKLLLNRILVLVFTYLAYTALHATRKPFSALKHTLKGDHVLNSAAVNNATTNQGNTSSLNQTIVDDYPGWEPFNRSNSVFYLSTIDTVWSASYAISMFITGHIAEKTSLTYSLVISLIMSGLTCSLLGVAKYTNLHSFSYFIFIQLLSGFFQSFGWPCVMAIMANWFGGSKLGTITGLWGSHNYVGNILGQVTAAYFINIDWALSFIIPGIASIAVGVVVVFFMNSDPKSAGISLPNKKLLLLEDVKSPKLHIGTSMAANPVLDIIDSPNDFDFRNLTSTFDDSKNRFVSSICDDETQVFIEVDKKKDKRLAIITESSTDKDGRELNELNGKDSSQDEQKVFPDPNEKHATEKKPVLLKLNSQSISEDERKYSESSGQLNSCYQDNKFDTEKSCSQVEDKEAAAIGFFRALLLPGVLEYSFSLFFGKLVVYSFLFWLPFYINEVGIKNYSVNPTTSGYLASIFDVGSIVGSFMIGIISDYTKSPGILCVGSQILGAIIILLYSFYGSYSFCICIFFLVFSGVFVSGPASLITTSVSASLSTVPELSNQKAKATVAAIIDGTGAIGAAVGPFIINKVSTYGWNYVMIFLMMCIICSALLLSRQFIREVRRSIKMSKLIKQSKSNSNVYMNSQ